MQECGKGRFTGNRFQGARFQVSGAMPAGGDSTGWRPNQRLWTAGASKKQMGAFSDIRIGISGWRYAGWRGKFYPQDLAQRRELEYASRRFNSIELNGSFYSLQR